MKDVKDENSTQHETTDKKEVDGSVFVDGSDAHVLDDEINVNISSDEVVENNDSVTIELSKSPEQLEIEKLQAENDELADRLLRAQAELQNVQRRQAKERTDLLRYQSQKLGTALLPVLDNLERALSISVDDEQAQALKKGVEMAYNGFVASLKENGIEAIDALNAKFDPTLHQAIQQVEVDGVESDTITQEFQKGYKLHERVLRPSMVVVSQ